MQHPKRLAVGMDFSTGSRNALLHAVRLAPNDPSAIRPVHVVDPLLLGDLADALHQSIETVRVDVERSARQEWAHLADHCNLAMADLKVVFDSAVAGLVAEAAAADLLVLGTHAEPKDDGGAGIVAAACARQAPGPVLLAYPTHHGPFTKVFVGVDFSDLSREALRWAASIAARDGADLHVVHAFHAPWHRLHYRAPTPEADPEFMRNFTGALERLLASFTESTPGITGVPRLHRHVVDAPQKHGVALVDLAKVHAADLVVVGAAGRRGLQQLILGSTAERVCRDATTSVLVVRPKAVGS